MFPRILTRNHTAVVSHLKKASLLRTGVLLRNSDSNISTLNRLVSTNKIFIGSSMPTPTHLCRPAISLPALSTRPISAIAHYCDNDSDSDDDSDDDDDMAIEKTQADLVSSAKDAYLFCGPHQLEKDYHEKYCEFLQDKGYDVEIEYRVPDSRKRIDLVVTGLGNSKILIECKAGKNVTKKHVKQVEGYMKDSGIRTSILVNFYSDRSKRDSKKDHFGAVVVPEYWNEYHKHFTPNVTGVNISSQEFPTKKGWGSSTD